LRSLLTGIDGFVGTHLTRTLRERGDSVWGICHPQLRGCIAQDEFPEIRVKPVDILNQEKLTAFVMQARPDRIFHLAAQSHVPTSWQDPRGTFEVNVIGTLNLLRAAARKKRPPRVLLVSSGDVYGDGANLKGPIRENSPISPQNPYAASKASAEWMALTMSRALMVPLVCVRPFNHIGPGQAPTFVASDFARQIARIEARLCVPKIRVGNLDTYKDFTDARDMVQAYLVALEKCPSGEIFNLCSGRSDTIREILNILIKLSSVKPEIVQDPAKQRLSRSNIIKASASKFRNLTGWKPRYSIRQTLKDTLEYWREMVRK
jgi:GDP-4-dehydro-6-deoxy-D-mannose reductase